LDIVQLFTTQTHLFPKEPIMEGAGHNALVGRKETPTHLSQIHSASMHAFETFSQQSQTTVSL